MAKRKIIKIDDKKCTGCGLCIPECPEGAIQIIDGKARLISDLFCDGLGACLGHCPEGAITIEDREAAKYDETQVMKNVVKQGAGVIKAHLEHLRSHGENEYLKEAVRFLEDSGIPVPSGADHPAHGHSGCPGSKIVELKKPAAVESPGRSDCPVSEPQLMNWPVQIKLVPVNAPYFNAADILIAADCVPFAYADFHEKMLKGRILLVGCPKLDDIGLYREKIGAIVKNNDVKSITYAHMEVPCCFGMIEVIKDAVESSGKKIPFKTIVIGIKGEEKRKG